MSGLLAEVLLAVTDVDFPGRRVALRGRSPQDGLVEAVMWINYAEDSGLIAWPYSKAERESVLYRVAIAPSDLPGAASGAVPGRVTINDLHRAGEGGRVVVETVRMPERVIGSREGVTQMGITLVYDRDSHLERFPNLPADMAAQILWIGGLGAELAEDGTRITLSPVPA